MLSNHIVVIIFELKYKQVIIIFIVLTQNCSHAWTEGNKSTKREGKIRPIFHISFNFYVFIKRSTSTTFPPPEYT